MGFYFGYHRLETVNENPIHPIAFKKNNVNSKLLAKVREGGRVFFPASLSSKRKNKNHPPGGKTPVVIMEGWFSFHSWEYNFFIEGNHKTVWFKTHFRK